MNCPDRFTVTIDRGCIENGVCGSGRRCALALKIAEVFPNAADIIVGVQAAGIFESVKRSAFAGADYPMPKRAGEFVVEFDRLVTERDREDFIDRWRGVSFEFIRN
ncbi:MAG: hypothetical protein OXH70_17500 [Acidobacteria bacterium]|nr:hypothetical protein [Acidobacteriota bacterium]